MARSHASTSSGTLQPSDLGEIGTRSLYSQTLRVQLPKHQVYTPNRDCDYQCRNHRSCVLGYFGPVGKVLRHIHCRPRSAGLLVPAQGAIHDLATSFQAAFPHTTVNPTRDIIRVDLCMYVHLPLNKRARVTYENLYIYIYIYNSMLFNAYTSNYICMHMCIYIYTFIDMYMHTRT